jgi:hypothetical protein
MLNETDAEQINRRRTTGREIADRIEKQTWPLGAQAHIGNVVKAGDVFPMIIVRVWGDSDVSCVQGQVFLDGNDCYWATSRGQVTADSTDKQGLWFSPPFVPQAKPAPTEAQLVAEINEEARK